jgi:hypothetical protein
MTRFKSLKAVLLWTLLLALPVLGRAEELFHIRHLSERELLKTYSSLMRDACLHADQFWQEWPKEPGAGLWGSGRSDNMNEGIRAISEMVLTCATLLKYSDALSPPERKEYSRKATAALRYAVASHLTGSQACTDGKPWGASWQSAMWAGTLGFGAWLMWDDLDAAVRKDLERVVASEADRFLKVKPPGGTWGDTKAEENGWNLTCITVAANMFPRHPHVQAWNQKAIEYMINTLSAPQDATDQRVADGRPVREWFSAANVYPNFTLENHSIFHPAYVACSSYFLTQAGMHYTYAHRPIPQAATHHLQDTWRMFQTLILPSADSAYPQGMDWELHGLPFVNLYASLATYQKDPLAARMEKLALQYLRGWQNWGHGDLAVPGSRLGFTRHAICAEQAAYGFLAHKLFGAAVKELTPQKAAALIEGVHPFRWVEFITHRTADKFVSFSWTNRIMGTIIPIGTGHEANPHFTVPISDGLAGSFELAAEEPNAKDRPLTPALSPSEGEREKRRQSLSSGKPKVLEHSWLQTGDGFETTGTLLLNGGRLKQILKITSVGQKTVVYEDRVTAVDEVSVKQERGLPLGIENDQLTAGRRVLFHQGGQTVFDWQHPQPVAAIPGSWVNVDGRLGAVILEGAGLAYLQAAGYQPGIAVCTDLLCGSLSARPRQFKSGEEVARPLAVLFTEVTPRQTESLAKACRLEVHQNVRMLHFKLPEGGEGNVQLL